MALEGPGPPARPAPPAWPSRKPALLDAAADHVDTTLLRALAVLRLVVGTYALVVNAARWRDLEHPAVGWVVVGVIVVWTFVASWAYAAPRRRGVPLLVVDFGVAAAVLLSTPYVLTDAMVEASTSTMPSFWVMVPVLAWAVLRGWRVGLVAAVLMSALDLSIRTGPTAQTWGNIFLLILGAGIVGYATDQVREATEARLEAERVAAVLSERARLARAVHDGVLQVLALVQRRGVEQGGPAEELGRLAGEQEVALRALVQGTSAGGVAASGEQEVDLVEALSRLASRTVAVTGPGAAVPLPAHVVSELAAVVVACLANVSRHVGEQAPAWVLVEDLPGTVVVSVRDQGPGIAPGRLEEAAAEGRLGVAESVRGRMRDLGGEAVLTTAPGRGTEWELTVPTGQPTGSP